MKVLYIGHYREGSGWAQAAIDYILALDAAGVDVVCRSVRLGGQCGELPPRIIELESKNTKGCNICIQHVLPHLMDYNGNFDKNIGLFVTETDSILYTGWPQRLRQMDELWVPNQEMVKVCTDSGLSNVKVIPHACDVARYERKYQPFNMEAAKGKKVFYFIGEYNRRKRISAVIQAYYHAFNRGDDVLLVIKVSQPDKSPVETAHLLRETDEKVKQQLRMYPYDDCYPPIAFITDRLTEDQLMGLHVLGDCYVTATFGDAWQIPAFDAMGMNNFVISSNCGGMKDYLSKYRHGYLINGQLEPVFGADIVFDDVQTGHEKWFSVNIGALSNSMKHANFIDSKNLYKDKNIGLPVAYQYSYEAIGKLMKETLDER